MEPERLPAAGNMEISILRGPVLTLGGGGRRDSMCAIRWLLQRGQETWNRNAFRLVVQKSIFNIWLFENILFCPQHGLGKKLRRTHFDSMH